MNPFDEKSLKQLKQFVDVVKANTDLLHIPQLAFFKEYLQSLNATIPPKKSHPVEETVEETVEEEEESVPQAKRPKVDESAKPKEHAKPKEEYVKPKVEEQETKVEEVVEEPVDPALLPPDEDYKSIQMGDPNKTVTEEEEGDALSLMALGRKEQRENNHELAIEKFTEAIIINPTYAVIFASRAESYLALKKPNAAIQDCNRALELNPDSGRALKVRGKARRYLGLYVEASYDLHQGNQLDYDDATDAMIKEIKERAEKALQKQRVDQEKKRIEELKREAAEKRRKQQEEEDKRRREEESEMPGGFGGMPGGFGGMPGGFGGMPGGMPGGFGGMPGMPGGMPGGAPGGGMGALFDQIMNDPEISALMKNPEISKKLMEYFMSQGKTHATDPEVIKVINLIRKKFPVGGATPGDASTSSKKPADDLD